MSDIIHLFVLFCIFYKFTFEGYISLCVEIYVYLYVLTIRWMCRCVEIQHMSFIYIISAQGIPYSLEYQTMKYT